MSHDVGNDVFDSVCSYLGWGDPGSPEKPSLWFIGMEEGAKWTKEKLERKKDVEFSRVMHAPGGWKVAQWVSKIACQLSHEYRGTTTMKAWRDYREERLWRDGSGVCHLNLYPLGKKSIQDWPEDYEELFGISRGQRDAYRQAVRDRRFPRIRKRWNECRPQAAVCFGKHRWSDFRKLFDLDNRDPIDRICRYDSVRILLIPFLGYGRPPMSNDFASKIAQALAEWGVTLP